MRLAPLKLTLGLFLLPLLACTPATPPRGFEKGAHVQPAKGREAATSPEPSMTPKPPAAHLAVESPSEESNAEADEALPAPYQAPLPSSEELASGPASELANLSPAACRKRLEQAGLSVERHRGAAPGIATPLRIQGALGPVQYRVPPSNTPYGLLDCRLALTLALMSEVLSEHGVVSLRIDNFYRPRARLPRRKKLSQHAHGLAADIVEFALEDGEVLNVEHDWQGERGVPSCGPEAKLVNPTEKAVRLRNLVCAVAARGLFHHILTPSYDAAHRDHLHLDIKRDAKWFGMH